MAVLAPSGAARRRDHAQAAGAGPRILEGLSRDADPAVRRAAVEAVEDLAIAAPARGS
jgi:hypothetical protein